MCIFLETKLVEPHAYYVHLERIRNDVAEDDESNYYTAVRRLATQGLRLDERVLERPLPPNVTVDRRRIPVGYCVLATRDRGLVAVPEDLVDKELIRNLAREAQIPEEAIIVYPPTEPLVDLACTDDLVVELAASALPARG